MRRAVLPEVKVGDKLLRVYRGREPEEVEVVRVGRKYLFVRLYAREYPFLLSDGYAKEGGTFTDRVATREMLDAEQRRRDALARLEELGWKRGNYWSSSEKIETLEAMIALLEADAASL